MLRNVKVTKMSKCLVVCPLNTVLNWVNEFEIWLDDVDFEIEVSLNGSTVSPLYNHIHYNSKICYTVKILNIGTYTSEQV